MNRIKREIGASQPISAESTLLWERWYKPMQAAAAQINAAITNTQNILAAIILEREGVSPDTHLLDIDKLRIIARPKTTKDNGDASPVE
jgi:hypothetical protein